MRFAFADPPYPGNARLYRHHQDYAGEVDHAELTARLQAHYDGWALCTSVLALPRVLALCPPDIITGAWFKPMSPPLGDHRRYNWEPVIVRPLRRYEPGYVPLALICSPPGYTFRATPEEHVKGEKPQAFVHWVAAVAGLGPGDQADDLYPGSGAVARALATYVPGPTVRDGYRPGPARLPAGGSVTSYDSARTEGGQP